MTPSLFVAEAIRTEMARQNPPKLKLKSIVAGRLIRVADILEMDPAAFGCAIIERYLAEIFKYGKLEELEVDGGIFSSHEEQERITLKAKAFDAERQAIRAEKEGW